MTGFAAFLAKERLEILRTWRIWVIPGMLLFFGVTSPVVALLTPRLLASLAGSEPGMVIRLPDPTAASAYAQLLKSLSQLVMIAVIIAGAGAISAERTSGTAILVLTKPLSRAAFVQAKLLSQMAVLVMFTVLATLIAFGMTRALFPPAPGEPLFVAVGLWLLHAGLLVSAMTFSSAVFRSRGAAAGAGLCFFFLSLLVSIWPAASRYSFVGLPGAIEAALRGAPIQAAWPAATAVLAAVGFAAAAVVGFRRAEL